MSASDPCFRCPLPDCDETAKGCLVRQLNSSYSRKVHEKQHAQITDEERAAMNIKFDIWDLERRALAAEHIRPYRRSGSAWTGDEVAH